MLLWVDDIRPAPEGWIWVKTAEEAIEFLKDQPVSVVSLDHDLADSSVPEKTGYTVACFIEERAWTEISYRPPEIRVHSANPVGRRRIQTVIASLARR